MPLRDSQRTASITTRIETSVSATAVYHLLICQRTASITTRIETVWLLIIWLIWPTVREQHPLQQGLRLLSHVGRESHKESENSIHYNKDWDSYILTFYKREVSQRTASITTRIETRLRVFLHIYSWCQRTASITTRIETNICLFDCLLVRGQRTASITTRIETKQGLHPAPPHGGQRTASITTRIETVTLTDEVVEERFRQRTASITTRIETLIAFSIMDSVVHRQRTASITTRIETYHPHIETHLTGQVREQHPLQQGLRLLLLRLCGFLLRLMSENSIHYNKDWDINFLYMLGSFKLVREQHPLQQGLRLKHYKCLKEIKGVREQHPLQQGLRQFKCCNIPTSITVREQHPLQQGLRLDILHWTWDV